MDREPVEFHSDGVRCVGYLYRPPAQSDAAPCVVMAHGFSGTQEGSLAANARDFTTAGLVALTFDYRGFGVSDGEPRQVVDIRSQHADWRAAVAFARTLNGVRADRIAVWGSSLSGAHVIAIAVSDPAIAAVVAQMPFNGFPSRVEGRSGPESRRLLAAAMRDWWAGRMGGPRHYVKAVGRPGEFAVIATAEAAGAIDRMNNSTWRNEVAPGALIDMAVWYRPGRRAHQLRMPVLLSLAERDGETPVQLARPIAMRAPRGELRCYPCSHFEMYNDPVRRIVVSDQISFLRTHLEDLG